MKIKNITQFLEQLAPLSYQEKYDNAGLIVGNPQAEVSGVLLSLDCTEAVIAEAQAKGCNLVVAHHPIVFGGLKKLNGKNYVERTVIAAIKQDIAIYATHTNLDNVSGGVNFKIAQKLGLQNVQILSPKKQELMKLTVFVPTENTQALLEALHEAGAGQIGEYKNCSFRSVGTGAFTPTGTAQPHIGSIGQAEEVAENRVEVIFPKYLSHSILNAMQQAHPYEEVAYYLHLLENENPTVGSGAVGILPQTLSPQDFLKHLKTTMNLAVIRHTAFPRAVQKVAVCGGAGSFLLPDAIRAGADVFVTADYKYHEFFDAENHIAICDIGHYESEVFTKDLLFEQLSKQFPTFAFLLSETNTNPIQYF